MSDISKIVDAYFDQIEIEDTEYVPWDDAVSDGAYLLLIVPTAMLRDYLALKGQDAKLPDGAAFWKESGLGERLRGSEKYHGQGHESLVDILDFLGGEVQVNYQELHDTARMRMGVYEVPTEYHRK